MLRSLTTCRFKWREILFVSWKAMRIDPKVCRLPRLEEVARKYSCFRGVSRPVVNAGVAVAGCLQAMTKAILPRVLSSEPLAIRALTFHSPGNGIDQLCSDRKETAQRQPTRLKFQSALLHPLCFDSTVVS